MQCIVVKSDEFENSSPLYIFPLNPGYVGAERPSGATQQQTYVSLFPILQPYAKPQIESLKNAFVPVDVHFLCSHLGISAIIRSLHQAALTYKTYWQYSQKCKLMHGKCFLPALVSYNVIFLLQLLRIDQKSILYFLCSQCLFQCY